MTQHSRRAATVLAVTFAGVLAACATPTAAPEAPAAAQAQDSGDAAATVTGSRIPRKSTERLVHKTGAAGAKEMERDRPPNPGGLNQ